LTLKPEAGGAAVASPAFAGSADPTVLLTYHAALGRPLPRFELPPEPVREMCWNAHYEIKTLLGHGAQGAVYLARREGVDGYHTHVALKVFHRPSQWNQEEYFTEMRRVARQAQRVSQIQHDNLISIRDFVALSETRVMVLEWVDGLDLARLLDLERMRELQRRLLPEVWGHLNDVIVTPGEDHCRLKPGIAVDILRGCLAGLSSLHHKGIVHCDLKPSNIMIKRTGTKKIVDIDSSCVLIEDQPQVRGTPYYMAPEQLRGKPVRLRSDVASLGYILIEMLTGQLLFGDCTSMDQLLEAKVTLPDRLDAVLPADVRENEILHGLVSKMVAVDPKDRFPDADAADLDSLGAASFHRHLVKMDLSTEYDRELAWWLALLSEQPATTAAT
jgi:serine/threonine-protein kinase